ncbi:MAG: glycosyltransferase [Solobacterium sp.]|nr:glycosyltransferase [Solobacterium sp.]
MKIGEFSDAFLPVVDGVGRVVYSYCDHIARTGNQCTAVVPLTKMGYRGRFPFEIIDYYCAPLPGQPQYSVGAPIIDEHYRQHLNMTDFDIVHVHSPFIAGNEGIRYARKHDIPIVGTFHSKYYDDFLQISHSRIIAGISTDVIVTDFFNKCDEVWTLTDNSAKTLQSYGCKRPIFLMPNGMDKRTVLPSQKEDAVSAFHLRTDVLTLLYVGQLNWKKNIRLILEACSKLENDGTDFQLVLAGQGPHQAEIESLCNQLGIKDSTVFTGHIHDVKLLDGLYLAADLFVFPSVYDTFSMVIREAANAGTPSVAVRNSAASECIQDQINGLLCSEDAEDLYQTIHEAIQDRSFLKQLGKAASETIPIEWSVIIEKVLDRYQFLIDYHKSAKTK